ncbi:MAG TPA: Hsp20/alpha crystallin family protein [Bdellovibrionales bacterium]|nr:Hsp20/alpha crystallin family protein [Bdellovibrionales bacterium]
MKRDLELFRPSNWYASREFATFQREMNRLFDQIWGDRANGASAVVVTPACDIDETDSHFIVTVDVPGMRKEDVKVEVDGDRLIVSGERKEERETKERNKYHSERYLGSFRRELTLPTGVNPANVEAAYENGELKIAVPKMEAAQTKSIPVGEGRPGIFARLTGQKEPAKFSKASGA